MSKPPLVVIAGPTASGKSALAMDFAERTGGVIVNADASQVYSDLRVLSARPSDKDERRVPHRLYGVVDGSVAGSAAMWAEMAKTAIRDTHDSGMVPVLVGGTGMYLRTLLDGMSPVPEIPSDVRDEVRATPAADLHPALAREDPIMAARLKPNDRQRLSRALEVVRATGRSLAEWQARNEGGIADDVDLRAYVVEVERDTLYRRCDERFDAMLAQDALAEVAALAARDLDPTLPVMRAIGVSPLLRHLSGELSLDEAATAAKLETRQYVKRQLTWWRNQTPCWTRVRSDGILE